MKNLVFITLSLLISSSALSVTISQKIAKETTAVLESKEVQTLISNENGMGTIESIKYLFSYRTSFGPAVYELSFQSRSGTSLQVCKVPAYVNTETVQVLRLGSSECKAL